MLRSLSIRDVVLIDRLDLGFGPGLSVLTGETGSGKSILLDALGLAIGARASPDLVRAGAAKTSVIAEFDIGPGHPAWSLIDESGLEAEPGAVGLILRRVLGSDGRSRAFINDQSVSVALLRSVGETLIEVQGQFEAHGLLDPATHGGFIDAHGGLGGRLDGVAKAYRAWREAAQARSRAADELARAKRDEDFVRHAVAELGELSPALGEEESLAARRSLMMHGEKIAAAVNEAAAELTGAKDVEAALRTAAKALEKTADKAGGRFAGALAALDRAAIETAEAAAELAALGAGLDADPGELERVEERLFALRGMARKHDVDVDGLAQLRDQFEARLAGLEDGGAALERLAGEEEKALGAYVAAADKLTRARQKAAARLDKSVMAEMPALNLADVKFKTVIGALDAAAWGPGGRDSVAFEVATNPGAEPGPLHRVASGGELARVMLALKVVLAEADPVTTIIFDEVDAGIGGAAAAAVGERLARLAQNVQVLVVTHSPQVAALGACHWRVSKSAAADGNRTDVDQLDQPDRLEEIARMLAGRKITDEARAAAGRLLDGGVVEEALT